MRKLRLGYWTTLGVLLAAMGITACAAPSGAPPVATVAPLTKLTAAYSEITYTNLPLYMAKEAGIFERHGLDVDVQYISSSTAVAALLSGQADISDAGGSEILSAEVAGADLEIVATLAGVYPYLVMAQPSITSPEELRGTKIGVSQPGSSSDIATRVALRKLGLNPDQDVTIVPVGSLANRTAALLSGAIDAGLDSPPGTLAQQRQGLQVLLDLASLKIPTANNTVVMQRSFVESHPDVVQRYVDSLIEAKELVRQDRVATIQLLKKYYQSDDDEAMAAAADLQLEVVPDGMRPTADQFTDIVDTLAAKDEHVRDFDLSKLLVTTYVQSAADRGVGQM